MNELYDFLEKHLVDKDCPISSLNYVFGINQNYIQITMKDRSFFQISECPNYTNIIKEDIKNNQ